jgi:predicted TIM-barrel fold metal-dependent hydrolase
VNQSAANGWDGHVHIFDRDAPAIQGHYAPEHHTLSEIESLAAHNGMAHLVLVQPSVYGHDNSLILQALKRSTGQHRGVVVLSHEETAEELRQWHTLGVRAVRYNLVSPVGNRMSDWAHWREAWAPRLCELGWHMQWYAKAEHLPQLAQWQRECGLPFVLDHLGGMNTEAIKNETYWQALETLAQGGAWIKLSAGYRLGLSAPYDLQALQLERMLQIFGSRCIWGSDWPHTGLAEDQKPNYAQTLRQISSKIGFTLASQLYS